MSKRTSLYYILGTIIVLLATYILLFDVIFTYRYKLDFPSFYSSCQAIFAHQNPYQVLTANYLPFANRLSVNLNPPIVLWLLQPFSHIPYASALIIWSFLGLIAGLYGTYLTFSMAFTKKELLNKHIYILLYLAFFPTLLNTAIAQVGGFLFFLLMTGYACYRKRYYYSAGFFWGCLAAFKLFPLLLICYIWAERRYRCLWSFIITTIGLFIIPGLTYGFSIYTRYFFMMKRVLWYGNSWNGSLYGFLARFYLDVHERSRSLLPLNVLGALLSIGVFYCYIQWLRKNSGTDTCEQSHRAFCLTSVIMILLSPFGWVYYFSMIIPALILTYQVALHEKNHNIRTSLIWLTCLFLLNFPMDYINIISRASWQSRITIHSFHFYGLWMLATLTALSPLKKMNSKENIQLINTPMYCILALGLIIIVVSLATHL